jgi:hypothetical protein
MSATLLYRIAAVIFVLFAAGHTFGFLQFKPPTAEGIAVRDAMTSVHFAVEGRSYSYGGFYLGLGLQVTVYLLFSAVLAWQLGAMAGTSPHGLSVVAWAFFAVQLAGLALSIVYFGPVPSVFSGVVAICIGVAAWLT